MENRYLKFIISFLIISLPLYADWVETKFLFINKTSEKLHISVKFANKECKKPLEGTAEPKEGHLHVKIQTSCLPVANITAKNDRGEIVAFDASPKGAPPEINIEIVSNKPKMKYPYQFNYVK